MKSHLKKLGRLLIYSLFPILTTAAAAQYTIEGSVTAGGGGTAFGAAGHTFQLDGTIGQPFAGGLQSGPPFTLQSGFWTSSTLPPTAAAVTIEGKILTSDGRGIRNVVVTLTQADGTTKTVLSTLFGAYRLSDIPAGQTVVIRLSAKQYTFGEGARVLSLQDNLTGVDFTAN